jgi:putative endonuclease
LTRDRQDLGREGELRASRYLEARGYRIVARNVRAARVELDVIARRGATLVFVEVKTRHATGIRGFGTHTQAAEAVDARKQARLRRGASAWLDEHPVERRRAGRMRFDVITCLVARTACADSADAQPDPQNDDTAPARARWSIRHWEAAF